MKFSPLTEQEIELAAYLPEGIYHYRVIKAVDGFSQVGNEKIDLTLEAWNDEGRKGIVFTNLSFIKLLKHFCDVNNMQDQYNLGEIRAIMCEKKSSGMVVIGFEPEKTNPKGGVFKAKNIVKDYIKDIPGSLLKPLPEVKNDFHNDDIPF